MPGANYYSAETTDDSTLTPFPQREEEERVCFDKYSNHIEYNKMCNCNGNYRNYTTFNNKHDGEYGQ